MRSVITIAGLVLIIIAVAAGGTQTIRSQVLLGLIPADELTVALEGVAFRDGPAPDTPNGIPHQQHNQNAPLAMQEALREAASALPGVKFEPTPFSLSGSVGWRLEENFARGPAGAFIPRSLEFAHQHRPTDGSLHMLLPSEFAAVVLEKGWGIIHPLTESISGERSEYLMVYGPRNKGELETVWIIAQISYYHARGTSMASNT